MYISQSAFYDPRADWTHTPAAPPPDPLLRLTPAGPASFTVNDLDRLIRWLESAGFHQEPARSPSEYRRLARGRQLVVIYHSMTALVQGQRVDETRALLAQAGGL